MPSKIELNYEEIYNVKILIYKDLKFQMREPSNEELNSYFKSNFNSKDKKRKKKNNNLLTKNSSEQKEQKKEDNVV